SRPPSRLRFAADSHCRRGRPSRRPLPFSGESVHPPPYRGGSNAYPLVDHVNGPAEVTCGRARPPLRVPDVWVDLAAGCGLDVSSFDLNKPDERKWWDVIRKWLAARQEAAWKVCGPQLVDVLCEDSMAREKAERLVAGLPRLLFTPGQVERLFAEGGQTAF